ncbi:MAG: ankyrin repeat domain-containing protein [Armatimonadetes bacterium]|nr:ankyrin repeat domain-containing protein [Armatimonadota bacterium]
MEPTQDKPEQRLNHAIWNRDIEAVREAIDAGADLNARGYWSQFLPLQSAVHCGFVEAITLLIQRGANPRPPKQYPNESNLLQDAARSKSVETVRLLLNVEFSIHETGSHGRTPLTDAVAQFVRVPTPDAVAVVEEFLAQGAEIDARDENGLTALHHAAWWSFPEAIPVLIAHGAAIEAVTDKGYTPLLYAVAGREHQDRRTADLVGGLLHAGANVHAQTPKGETPLHFAAANRAPVDVLQLLLDAGANLEATAKRGITPLAGALGSDKTFAFLLRAGADVAPLLAAKGKPALLTAVENENAVAVRVLLQAGADANEVYRGKLALHAAIRKANPDIVAALLAAGADISLSDKTGITALEYAHRRRRNDVLVLVEAARHTNNVSANH